MLHLDFFNNFNPYISRLTHIYFDFEAQSFRDGMFLLFCASLKSISGIQEQQSHRGCSITYFSRVWYLRFEGLWLSTACVCRAYAAASTGACGGEVVVVVGDNEQLLWIKALIVICYQAIYNMYHKQTNAPMDGHQPGDQDTVQINWFWPGFAGLL